MPESGTSSGALLAAARDAIADCEGGALVERALAGRAGEGATAPWIVGAGKAAQAMAMGARRAFGDCFRAGPLVGKAEPGAAAEPRLPTIVHAGHPLPDERSVRATEAMLAFLGARSADERVVLLISGGASALLGAPVGGLSLEAMRDATARLLGSGLPIAATNAVRKHLGRALGGRLALATAARLEVLALSDVVGDDPSVIGSGPAAADPSTWAEALGWARAAGITGEALSLLERGAAGGIDETPKPRHPRLEGIPHRILATPLLLRERAAARVAEAGLRPVVEAALVEGDVEALAARYAARLATLERGEALVAVGEPTLRLRGAGRGGRAQQLALEVALRIAGRNAAFVALGSDGSDGPTDAAGAAIDGGTAARAAAAGIDLRRALDDNDAYPALRALGALVHTGPTGTNLLDLHLLASL